MAEEQSAGRKANGAAPGGKPEPGMSSDTVKRNGRRERSSAGPDGPDASVVGETFKTW